MMLKIVSREKLVESDSLMFNGEKLNYAANPLLLKISKNQSRLFFNSRDLSNRSSIYSIDVKGEKFSVDYSSIRLQHQFGNENTYYSHGISIGSIFEFAGKKYISVMGWKIDPGKHWEGRIGKVEVDERGDLIEMEEKAWFELDKEDPISLSYPAIFQDGEALSMWYGSTVNWNAGNGEMLHILKEKRTDPDNVFRSSKAVIPYKIGTAQAFSRPSVIQVDKRKLMAYSYRGANDKYKIGFIWLDDFSTASQVGGIPSFLPTASKWENEMVEYPSLFMDEDKIFMLYNGNDFGKTGIGIAQISIT